MKPPKSATATNDPKITAVEKKYSVKFKGLEIECTKAELEDLYNAIEEALR